VRSHSRVGYELLKEIDFPKEVYDIVRQHHERLDGSGYPDGLRGDQISLEARIIAVADVVEAMSFHRPYRPALGVEKALEEISRERDKLLDAEVVDACLRLFQKGFKLE
jgi:HD-GYP domain-containing protein (c-di-GMP phosphodiesterase class II)